MKVTVAPALFGPMANVGFLEQIWRVKPNWSTTLTDDDWVFSRTIRAASRLLLLLLLLLLVHLLRLLLFQSIPMEPTSSSLLAHDEVGGKFS